jgi:hypothetical protein
MTQADEATGGNDSSPFVSTLLLRAKDGPGQASGDQWRTYLRALVSRGVSPEEIRWTAVEEWLDVQPGPIRKDAVLAYLQHHAVKVTEVVKGKAAKLREVDRLRVELDALGYTIGTSDDGSTTYLVRRRDGQRFQYDIGWDAFMREDSPDDDEVSLGCSVHQRDRDADRLARHYERRTVGDDFYDMDEDHAATRYERYRQAGGDNYREVLLTLPAESMAPGFDVFRSGDGGWGVSFPNGPPLTGWKTREAAMRSQDCQPGSLVYKSPHWAEPNVLLHVRLTDRTDAEGRSVLFVEEIQSDWAQTARREGYIGERPDTTGWLASPLAGPQCGKWRVVQADGRLVSPTIAAASASAAIEVAAQHLQHRGVPRAPFIQATDAWVQLALKKVLQIAAEGGFARVAFVTGQQAVDLYGLETIADQIDYDDQTSNLVVHDKRSGRPALTRTAAPQELPKILGEVLARSLLASPDRARGFRYSLKCGGVKLGGEGMRVFYDRIVPVAAAEMIRRLGGAGLTEVAIPKRAASADVDYADLRADLRVVSRGAMSREEFFENWPQLRGVVAAGDLEDVENRDPHNRSRTGVMITLLVDRIRDLVAPGKRMQQVGFDITPAFRTRILQGMPLFSLSAARSEVVDLEQVDLTRGHAGHGMADQRAVDTETEEDRLPAPRG